MFEGVDLLTCEGPTGAPTGNDSDSEEDYAVLRDFSAPLVEERLRRLNRVREIVQEHLGFAPGEVSLRDAALVQWMLSSSVALCTTQRVWHRRCCSTDGIRHWPRKGRTGGGSVS